MRKISLHAAAYQTLKQGIHRIHPVDTKTKLQLSIYLCHNDVLNMAGEHTLAEQKLKVTP